MKNYQAPDEKGFFGEHGGLYVSETLIPALQELADAYQAAKNDPSFWEEFHRDLKHYVGRPSPVYHAARLSDHLGGAQIWLKREDLNHTGAHKVNNTIGQALLARRMGKKRVIAETGAGQHGVASSRTLKDAMNEAMREWVARVDDTFYIIGTAAGPAPYPEMVRDFQCVIGNEAKAQMQEAIGRQPDVAVACVGGGSNAIGLFHPYIGEENVRLIGVEAGGLGVDTPDHAAPITSKAPIGVLHGFRSYLMQDENGQVLGTHSVSAGLDYPGIGPEHSHLNDIQRVEYTVAKDDEALEAFDLLCRFEGIIPALESSHALAWAVANAPKMGKDQVILVNLSGRGDKDINTVAKLKGIEL